MKNIHFLENLRKTDDCVLYYNLQFDENLNIRVDKELHVQLQFSGNPLLLPYWFARGTNATLCRFGMLINLPPYIRNFSGQNPYSLIEKKKRNYKPKGRHFNRTNYFTKSFSYHQYIY